MKGSENMRKPKFEKLSVALCQMAPVWFDRKATLEKVNAALQNAAKKGAQLAVFGEGLVPGYPFWLEPTGGAKFNDSRQKQIFSHYALQAVCIENGHLDLVCKTCEAESIACYLGIIERPKTRSGSSLYCSLVYIDSEGKIQSVHRKLMPTYEERLVWSPGDGHGLRTHQIGEFVLGGLNCWENWLPLARTALYAQGENVHISVWPGNVRNTEDLMRFIALEGRCYAIGVSGLFSTKNIPEWLKATLPEMETHPGGFANGGTCVCAPDGAWVLPPQADEEGVFLVELDHQKILEERQNMDNVGHYSRPDVLSLKLNSTRQNVLDEE